MTDDEKQAIKYFYNLRATIDESYMLFDEEINVKCGKETIKQISVVLNLIEKQQTEINKYKEMYAVSVADRVNSAFKQEYKNNEDLEMLYKGCQIELEEKDKYINKLENKLMYALSPTTHELALNTQEQFKAIIRDNLEEDTYTIKRALKEYWKTFK